MYTIYTDGATSGNGYEGAQGGWAWILLDENENIVLKTGIEIFKRLFLQLNSNFENNSFKVDRRIYI